MITCAMWCSTSNTLADTSVKVGTRRRSGKWLTHPEGSFLFLVSGKDSVHQCWHFAFFRPDSNLWSDQPCRRSDLKCQSDQSFLLASRFISHTHDVTLWEWQEKKKIMLNRSTIWDRMVEQLSVQKCCSHCHPFSYFSKFDKLIITQGALTAVSFRHATPSATIELGDLNALSWQQLVRLLTDS